MTAELPAPLTNALEQVRQWTLRGGGVLLDRPMLPDGLGAGGSRGGTGPSVAVAVAALAKHLSGSSDTQAGLAQSSSNESSSAPEAPPDADVDASQGGAPEVHPGKQGKHIEGHNNYKPGRSKLTADPGKLAGSAGTGEQVGAVPVGEAGSKERVDFGEVMESTSTAKPEKSARPQRESSTMTGKEKSTSSRRSRDVKAKLLLQRALLGEVFERLLAVGFEWTADDRLVLWAYCISEPDQEDRNSLSSIEAELYADELAESIETRVIVQPDLVLAGVAGQVVFCRRLPVRELA